MIRTAAGDRIAVEIVLSVRSRLERTLGSVAEMDASVLWGPMLYFVDPCCEAFRIDGIGECCIFTTLALRFLVIAPGPAAETEKDG